MARFHYQKLAVSEEAFNLVVLVDGLASRLERKRYYLADQIRRAALSVLLNIGEAAAEFNPAEKAHFRIGTAFCRRSCDWSGCFCAIESAFGRIDLVIN
jgi:hypothetical protein